MAHLIERIQKDIRTYVVVTTAMSLLTGFVSFAVLSILGLDFAAYGA